MNCRGRPLCLPHSIRAATGGRPYWLEPGRAQPHNTRVNMLRPYITLQSLIRQSSESE